MNLLNREQLASLWFGIIAISIMGLMPPWREAGGSGNPLIYASIAQPPTSLSTVGVTIDYVRLSVQWIVAIFITGGLIASFHKVTKPTATAPDKQDELSSARQAAQSSKSSGDGISRPPTASSGGIVDINSRESRDKKSASAVSGRTLSFPKESMGDLLIESDEDDEYWEFFSHASGTVTIPSGKRVQLEIVKNSETRLNHLSNLPADAFYSLDFSGSRLSDSDLENIRHLTGVRELDLSDTSVSDLGIKSLSGLPKLQKIWLDNTRVTDKGLGELSNHRELSKISLIGTQINEPDAKSVVKTFPQKCELVLEDNG